MPPTIPGAPARAATYCSPVVHCRSQVSGRAQKPRMGGTSEMEARRVELRRGLIFAGDVDRRQFRQRIGEPWLGRIERARRFQRQRFQASAPPAMLGESGSESIQVAEQDAADIEDFSRQNCVAEPRREPRRPHRRSQSPGPDQRTEKTGETVEQPARESAPDPGHPPSRSAAAANRSAAVSQA